MAPRLGTPSGLSANSIQKPGTRMPGSAGSGIVYLFLFMPGAGRHGNWCCIHGLIVMSRGGLARLRMNNAT